jgi:hypothetical protein
VILQRVVRRELQHWILSWHRVGIAATTIQRRVRGIQCREFLRDQQRDLDQLQWDWQFGADQRDFGFEIEQ